MSTVPSLPQSSARRVVVTGMGVVTPIGVGLEAFWSCLCAGVSGVTANDLFDTSGVESKVIARVRGFDPESYLDRKEAKRTDRFVHFAVAATQEAIRQAGLTISDDEAPRAGTFIGSGVGGMWTMIEACRTMRDKGMGRVSPFTMPMMLPNMAAGQIARMVNAKGPSEAPVTACASGTNAVGDAFRAFQRGDVDIALAGGAEAALNELSIASFSNMRGISRRNDDPQRASRPFDKDRDGFVPSEGAGIMVLETLEHALGRGARPLGEIIGYGSSNDAYDMVHPSPGGTGAGQAMSSAIADAGLTPEDFEYINPHATSTHAGDMAENGAIKLAFGKHAYNLAISATKSMTGHMIGAAGAVEAIATVMALRTGTLPPTINLDNPDEGCDLNYVAHTAQHKSIRRALSNSFGFGGHNATIALARYDEGGAS